MVGAGALLTSWLVLGAAPAIEPAAAPEIDRPVTDLAGVLDPDDEEAIARELVEHREETGVQLAVLVVNTTQPEEIADYSQRVFTHWGGGSAERDDGALFVLAIADRRSRLHLGYGLETVIPDATAQLMLDELRPDLQDGRYAAAARQLVHDFAGRTAHLRPGRPISVPLGGVPWVWLAILVLGVVAGVAWGRVFRAGWAVYRKDAKVKSKAHRTKPWTARAKVAVAFLARLGPVRIAAAAFLAAQIVFAVLFFAGRGYLAAYSLIFWAFVGVGWALVPLPRAIRIPLGFSVLAAIAVGIFVIDPSAILPDGAAVLEAAGPALGTFGMLGLGSAFFMANLLGGSAGGSSASYSSTSSSYSSSSYTSGSSSSYSSSSYSGGGGSSGGGGASSSW